MKYTIGVTSFTTGSTTISFIAFSIIGIILLYYELTFLLKIYCFNNLMLMNFYIYGYLISNL